MYKKWCKEEILFLKRYGIKRTVEKFGRSYESVYCKSHRLGLYHRNVNWTYKEIQYLKDYSYQSCLVELSRHTENAIKNKLSSLKIRKYDSRTSDVYYTKEEETYLKLHYNTDRAEDIATYLGVSLSAIYNKANKLGLRKKSNNKTRRWALREYLINTYPNIDRQEVIRVFGVTSHYLSSTISALKLKEVNKNVGRLQRNV